MSELIQPNIIIHEDLPDLEVEAFPVDSLNPWQKELLKTYQDGLYEHLLDQRTYSFDDIDDMFLLFLLVELEDHEAHVMDHEGTTFGNPMDRVIIATSKIDAVIEDCELIKQRLTYFANTSHVH